MLKQSVYNTHKMDYKLEYITYNSVGIVHCT